MKEKHAVSKSVANSFAPFGNHIMSRIGKLPVAIPAKVKCSVEGDTVSVEGPKGKVSQSFGNSVSIAIKDDHIEVNPANQSRHAEAMHGTVRSIINGMVKGVVDGYKMNLEISGVGFKAALQGSVLDLALGYSHPVRVDVPAGVTVTVADGTKIEITGASKQAVGQLAARIKQFYPVEPYKGKGVRIVGQHVRRKEGKKTA